MHACAARVVGPCEMSKPCRHNWKLHAVLRDIRDRKPAKIDLSRSRDETVINDEAAVLIAEALRAQSPPTVQHVDLQGNAVGDAGAAALAEVVAGSDVLVSLNLQQCSELMELPSARPNACI